MRPQILPKQTFDLVEVAKLLRPLDGLVPVGR